MPIDEQVIQAALHELGNTKGAVIRGAAKRHGLRMMEEMDPLFLVSSVLIESNTLILVRRFS
jgi:hypothetical protein